MALHSTILAGSSRLERAAAGGGSVKKAPPPDDPDAVGRIQRALVALGYPMPKSFPSGPTGPPDGKFGRETYNTVIAFQKRVFPSLPREWDGRVGPNTLRKLDALLLAARPQVAPPPTVRRICGPDVTRQIAATWTRIQGDFRRCSFLEKIRACNTILIPFQIPDDSDDTGIPTDLEELMAKLRRFADIDGWDTLPLYQGASRWLRTPPVFDRATNGPCATPSSSRPNADAFDSAHEDPNTCSNTVQVADQCWLNGTVNYGTFGVMVRLCNQFAATDFRINALPDAARHTIRTVYSLQWAIMLISAYKSFGHDPEPANLPIAWTTATYIGGPHGVPTIPGNRPQCACECGCSANVTRWDYVWEPLKPR